MRPGATKRLFMDEIYLGLYTNLVVAVRALSRWAGVTVNSVGWAAKGGTCEKQVRLFARMGEEEIAILISKGSRFV